MNEWNNVNADLIIVDPPFGIEFNGKPTNYHRKAENVVDGYVEWNVSEYGEKIQQLLECIKRNLKENGQALIFSGWNNSNIIPDSLTLDEYKIKQRKIYLIESKHTKRNN
ncbi:MAG: hypothetical protein ACK413_02880, partial [Patescibacteria group bacterium]